MPKLSIYVPDDLHKELANRPDINLSSLAQEAFVQALATPKQEVVKLSPVRRERRVR